MSINNVLHVKDLTIRYNDSIAVDNVSFDVGEGDLLGIVGPNGSGKTTLFRAILGLEPYKGKITMFGYEPDKFKSLIPLVGYVPQQIIFEPYFPATVYDVVSMGVISKTKTVKGAKLIQQCGCCWNKLHKRDEKTTEKINTALNTVGIKHLKNRRIGELSGGEQQRVFIAQSLVKDPILMILDEPTTSIDVESQTKFYSMIKKLNEDIGITIIWSSHDLDAIEKYASMVACMNSKLFFHGKKEQFFADEKILKTYTESAMYMHNHMHQ